MSKSVNSSDFIHGNFIKEIAPKYYQGKKRTKKSRRVLLKCLNCTKHFDADLYNALRTQQQCCSTRCYKRMTEHFVGGNEKHPLYTRWLAMKQRCLNPNSNNYPLYGGRGITIEDFLLDFVNYVNYVTSLPNYPMKLSKFVQLDRIDNDGNYCRGNLRWADMSLQTTNQTTKTKGSNKYVGVNYSITHQKWIARLHYKGKCYCSSTHDTEEQALIARNTTIKLYNLPHKIQ